VLALLEGRMDVGPGIIPEEESNFVFWTSAASSLTLLSLYYVFNVAQVRPTQSRTQLPISDSNTIFKKS
jgi:hypothetical protein